jgi:hypothetical protein
MRRRALARAPAALLAEQTPGGLRLSVTTATLWMMLPIAC